MLEFGANFGEFYASDYSEEILYFAFYMGQKEQAL